MSNEQTALQVEKLEKPISVGEGGVVLHTAHDVWAIAKGICNAKMAPASLDTTDKVAVAILTGAEAGLAPMAAVRSIYVVNGAPAWLTKAARALILNSGLLKEGTSIQEGIEHAEDCPAEDPTKRCVDKCYGYCRTHRRSEAAPRTHKFYVADAKRAKLWDKKGRSGAAGVWQLYPNRMLMHRAAGMHFDDCWTDLLMGLTTVEVLQDLPPAAFVKEGETVATYADPPGRDPLLPRATGGPEESGIDAHGEPADSDEPAAEAATHDATEAPDSSDSAGGPPEGASAEPDPELTAAAQEEEPEPAGEVCEAQGCGHEINLGTEVSWPTPTGRRCNDCGPPPKAK